MATKYVKGGKKLGAFLRKAKSAQGVKSVEVGFFASSKYPDGTPVTNVATWNEFGTETKGGKVRIPERPFFRQAINDAEDVLPAEAKKIIDPKTMVVDRQAAEKLGLVMQGLIQTSITRLDEPANAPSTIAQKGSSNPLLDTSFMRSQVSFKVNS